MELKEKIKKLSSEISNEIIAFRQHLHSLPELSLEEKETSLFVCEKLDEYGIEYKTFEKHYGVLGIIRGLEPNSKVVALRADMDALAIIEENNVPYKSKNHGVMHACGHDAHTASLLGTAKILNQLRNDFKGTIKLVFQPSEETYPGGALMMINDGVLQKPDVDIVIGQHVIPTIDAGKVGFKTGMSMASTDEIYITVKGKGGHGATPELNIDPVTIGAQIIVALQQIVSRNAAPQIPTVLSFGRFIAEGKVNIIPDEAKIEGTFRSFSEPWREKAHLLIKKSAEAIASGMGASAEVKIVRGYPFLVNNEALTIRLKKSAVKYLGADFVEDMDLRMTAEDFAYFSQNKPSCFYRIGIRNLSKGIVHNLHTSRFDIDEEVFPLSVGLMAYMAVSELGNE
ncbi:MAG: M20 family metallopeptidase [Bacteroidales bacterium]|nr:M20 family metallopeptidase [Bacteroidales bacterium]